LKTGGVEIAPITLHVGYGTFLPIASDDVEKHVMEPEYYEIGAESITLINNAQRFLNLHRILRREKVPGSVNMRAKQSRRRV